MGEADLPRGEKQSGHKIGCRRFAKKTIKLSFGSNNRTGLDPRPRKRGLQKGLVRGEGKYLSANDDDAPKIPRLGVRAFLNATELQDGQVGLADPMPPHLPP